MKSKCETEGCEVEAYGRGYCKPHYMAMYRAGAFDGDKKVQIHPSTIDVEDFWQFVKKELGIETKAKRSVRF